jgi:hypothetical protein
VRSSSGLSKTLCRGRDADIVAELPWNGTDKSAVESGSGSGCDSPRSEDGKVAAQGAGTESDIKGEF